MCSFRSLHLLVANTAFQFRGITRKSSFFSNVYCFCIQGCVSEIIGRREAKKLILCPFF